MVSNCYNFSLYVRTRHDCFVTNVTIVWLLLFGLQHITPTITLVITLTRRLVGLYDSYAGLFFCSLFAEYGPLLLVTLIHRYATTLLYASSKGWIMNSQVCSLCLVFMGDFNNYLLLFGVNRAELSESHRTVDKCRKYRVCWLYSVAATFPAIEQDNLSRFVNFLAKNSSRKYVILLPDCTKMVLKNCIRSLTSVLVDC